MQIGVRYTHKGENMAEKTFEEAIREASEAIRGLQRGIALSKTRSVVEKCSRFKIGKTGETLEERFSQPDYKDRYQHIDSLYSSSSQMDVDNMERDLLLKYIFHPKCDNMKDGLSSHSDTMRENAEKYHVYIVWND